MADFLQRDYYKIFTGTNQATGHEKVHLGYESDTAEILFKKDKTTYFHIPFFSAITRLVDSTLVSDGAVPGPIPAMADRIYKKQAGYGKETPLGNTSQIEDGTWLCSWLYAPIGGIPTWLDRYYDPGRLPIEEALAGDVNILSYISNEPLFYDIPSQMLLEPRCWYQYFHQGEKTNFDIVQTYKGLSGDKIKLDIENWSETTLDESIYKNQIQIDNFDQSWVMDVNDPGFTDRNSLNFNNNSFINARVSYDSSYNSPDEFTMSFWAYNNDWSKATSTQLVGNIVRGGYGVFYNNLKVYNYYVIPETTYGHLFLFNSEGKNYQDKNIQRSAEVVSKPIFCGLTSDSETIVVDEVTRRVYKYNHLGDLLAISKKGDTAAGFFTFDGLPKTAIIGGDDRTTVLTTSGTFVFDKELVLTQSFPLRPFNNESLTYNFEGNLIREANSLDIKYDYYNNKWVIDTDGKLFCNDVVAEFTGNVATNLAIDPENNIWVLADSNDVYKYSSITKKVIAQYKIGILSSSVNDTKNISFIHTYNREDGSMTWYAIIVYNYEQNAYQVTLDGAIKDVTHLPERLDIQYPITSTQDPDKLTFTCKGDFTGYERQRVFNKYLFNDKKQLQFKVGAKKNISGFSPVPFTVTVPVDFFVDNTWYLVTCTVKDKAIKVFVNGRLQGTGTIPNNYELVYEYKNDLYIGTPAGKITNYNYEINSQAIIWNGLIDSIRIYDFAGESDLIQAFVREKIISQDLTWNIPTASLQYIETIERFFKHRLPGHKSPFFNIKLSGLKITDLVIRKQIEEEVKLAISQIKPAYSQLLKVEWLD